MFDVIPSSSSVETYFNILFPKLRILSDVTRYKDFMTFKNPSSKLLPFRYNWPNHLLCNTTDANASPASSAILLLLTSRY